MADYVPLGTGPAQIGVPIRQQFQDFANVLKAFIGTGYLALPFAFYNSGLLLGVVGLTLIATITSHCCQLIVKCKGVAVNIVLQSLPKYNELKNDQCHEELTIMKEKVEKEMTLGDIGRIAVGKWGVRIVNFALVVTQTGFCVAYFIFMGNTIEDMFHTSYQEDGIGLNYTIACDGIPPVSVEMAQYQNQNSSSMAPPLLGTSSAPAFGLLVLIPMPALILMAFIRDLRKLGPISGIANVAILAGFVAFLVYMLKGLHFKVHDVQMAKWDTFAIFFGQITCSYEGIGTIIPIESSMAENRPRFPLYLGLALVQYSIFLGSFGLLGYLIYGSNTPQLVTTILPDALFSQFIRVALVLAVLFTYPLQLYPVIEIAEGLIFSRAPARGRHQNLSEVIAGPSTVERFSGASPSPMSSSTSDPSTEATGLLQEPDAQGIPSVQEYKASTCARNLLRTVLVIITAGIAVLLKDEFAYALALIGSMGSSLLAYVLPCICHLIFFKETNSYFSTVKDVALIVFGIVGGITGVVVTIQNIVMDFNARQ